MSASEELPRWAVERKDGRSWRPAAIVVTALAILGVFALAHRGSSSSSQDWHRSAIEQTVDGVCKKTLLYRFDDRRGFGSEITMPVQLPLQIPEDALLIDDSRWNYGVLSAYFSPRTEECVLPPNVHQLQRTEVGQGGWEQAQHLLTHRFTSQHIDYWVATTLVDMAKVWEMEAFNPLHPLAHDMVVPAPFRKAYDVLYATHEELFRPQPDILEAIERLEYELGIGKQPRAPVIGLHYRGGDKIGIECTLESNCANSTIYAMAAVQALDSLPPFSGRPILAVMTVEPHMEDIFRAEPLVAERFEVRRLPPSPAAGVGHDEGQFLDLPMETRIADTKVLLRDAIFLSQRADAVVASMRSNIGLIMAQWTPRGHPLPFSIDSTFYPLSNGLDAIGLRPPR